MGANHHNCLQRSNVWHREYADDEDAVKQPLSYRKEQAELSLKRPRFSIHEKNDYLDVDTKKAAFKAAASVVSLSSHTGDEALSDCCGVIIEKDGSDVYTVLTSAKLVRCPTKKNVLEDYLVDSLKFMEMIWDKKVGDVLELAVVRGSEKESISVSMLVEEVVGNFYRWPRK